MGWMDECLTRKKGKMRKGSRKLSYESGSSTRISFSSCPSALLHLYLYTKREKAIQSFPSWKAQATHKKERKKKFILTSLFSHTTTKLL